MKRKLLSLLVFSMMAASVGWVHAEEPVATKITQEQIGDQTYVYANGYPVTVAEATAEAGKSGMGKGITITTADETPLTFEDGTKVSLFGGAKNKAVTSSSITMESGTIQNIYGGGYGELPKSGEAAASADVTGATRITIKGGNVANILLAGGMYYARSEMVTIAITGDATSVGFVLMGGYDAGKTTNQLDTEFEASVNRVAKTVFSMTKGTITGYIGCGGGQGYSYSKETAVTLNGVKLNCLVGIGSNGRSDNVVVEATECTFTSGYEIASVNRGRGGNIEIAYNTCTFTENAKGTIQLGATHGWANGTNGTETPTVTGKLDVSFTGCTNTPEVAISEGLDNAQLTLTGAKGIVKKVYKVSNKGEGNVPIDQFTLGQGASWLFANGLTFATDDKAATLTREGELQVTISNSTDNDRVAELAAAVKDVPEGTTIALDSQHGAYTLAAEAPLEINKKLQLVSLATAGAKAAIEGRVIVDAEGVTLKDLSVTSTSTGTEYWKKNAVTLFGNAITVSGCDFTGKVAEGDKEKYVANGIVIFPAQTTAAAYAISGNVFSGYNFTTSDNWTSTALLLADNTSITKKNAAEATTIPALTAFDEASLGSAENTFTDCFANYTHLTKTNYVYATTDVAAGLSDAFKGMATGTIVATGINTTDALVALNALTEKPDLANKLVTMQLSGANLVTHTSLAQKGDLLLIKTDKGYETTDTEPLTVDFTKVSASVIEAGQPLSAAVLTAAKGAANKAGQFAWKNPGAVATESAEPASYPVIFTPLDQTLYSTQEGTVSIGAVVQYYTVTIGKSANGTVSFKEAKAGNRYAKGTTLTLANTPDANYTFTEYWKGGAKHEGTTYQVTETAEFTGLFGATMKTVTVTGANGSVSINGQAAGASQTYQQGTVLTIQGVPAEGYVLKSLKVGGAELKGNTVTVNGDLAIAATFEAKPADKLVVTVPATAMGKILLYDANGNALQAGTAVTAGTKITVVAKADFGCKQSATLQTTGETNVLEQKNKGELISSAELTVNEAASLSATFAKESYTVTSSITPNGGTIAVAPKTAVQAEETTPAEPAKHEYGTVMTATVFPAAGYKLLSLVVNGKEIPNAGEFTVAGNTTVVATLVEKADVGLSTTTQQQVYDNTPKAFAIRTTQAGVAGFTVSYASASKNTAETTAPVDAGSYTVTIARAEDATYKAVSATATLVIEKATLKGIAFPVLNDDEKGVKTTSDKGEYVLESNKVNENTHIGKVTFTPTDKNYAPIVFSVAGKSATPFAQGKMRAADPTFSATGTNGSVKVLNGSTEAAQLYVGQTITLQAIPQSSDYAANATWTGTDGKAAATNKVEITLEKKSYAIVAAMPSKQAPTLPTLVSSATYSGSIQSGVKGAENWTITYAPEGSADFGVQPIDAGKYTVKAVYAGDENTLAYNKVLGTFAITPKTIASPTATASAVLKGETLAQSVITGSAEVDGRFEWKDPTTVMTQEGEHAVVFTPSSANYASAEANATVGVIETNVTTRLVTLSVSGTGNLSLVAMTLDGQTISGGAAITAGQELVVKAQQLDGSSVAIKVNGAAYVNGSAYAVPASGDVKVEVVYTTTPGPGPGPGPTPDPGPVGVETVIGDSKVYGGTAQLVVEPAMPVRVTVVNMAGHVLYNDRMSATTYVSAQAGIYVIALTDGKETVTYRVIVR